MARPLVLLCSLACQPCEVDSVITAVAFVPSTPMMIPVVAAGAADELGEMRQIAITTVADVIAGANNVVIVAGGASTRLIDSGVGTMRGFGVPLDLHLGDGGNTAIGLAGTIGLWLVEQAGWQGPVAVLEVAGQVGAESQRVAQEPGATALVVVGDGSAARTEKAPGYLHPDAEAFDSELEAALVAADLAALTADSNRADAVMASGVDAWRAAANAVADTAIQAQVNYAEAPHGVGYFIASWRCGEPRT